MLTFGYAVVTCALVLLKRLCPGTQIHLGVGTTRVFKLCFIRQHMQRLSIDATNHNMRTRMGHMNFLVRKKLTASNEQLCYHTHKRNLM